VYHDINCAGADYNNGEDDRRVPSDVYPHFPFDSGSLREALEETA
jgi:hypothetical protein